MGHDVGELRAVGHINGLQCLGQGANLVDLHEHGVGRAFGDTVGQAGRVGHKQIIANQLDFVADFVGQHFPAVPVIL